MKRDTKYLAWRLFFKRRVLSVPLLAFGALLVIACGVGSVIGRQDPMYVLPMVLRTPVFVFILFLFLSYEYFYMCRQSGLEETLKSTKNGWRSLLLHQLLCMAGLALLLTAALLLVTLLPWLFSGPARAQFLWHVMWNLIVNFLGISLIGILMGLAAALLLGRLPAYLAMSAFTLFASPFGERFANSTYLQSEVNIYPAYNLINIFPLNVDWEPNMHFGYCLQSYRLELLCFWGLMMAGVSLYCLSRKKRGLRAAAAVLLLCGVISLGLYSMPVSKTVMDGDPNTGYSSDLDYYYQKHPQLEEDGGFHITGYRLEFTIRRELKAQAELTVDQPDLGAYKLTLYHGYQVGKAQDESGNPLEFRQEGDYLTVFAKGPVQKIRLDYRGSSGRFYSNAQGTDLPGFFPYYPQSGYREVYDVSHQGFLKVVCPQPAAFEVTVHTPKKVFCSLPQTEDGAFRGTSDGVTLLSGMLDERTVDGVEIVYPYLDTLCRESEMKAQVESLKKAGILKSNVKKILLLPNTNLSSVYERCSEYADHMTADQLAMTKFFYELQKMRPEKKELYDLLQYYHEDTARYMKILDEPAKKGDDENLTVLLAKRIQSQGEAAVLKKSSDYMYDNGDRRTALEFLQDL